MVHESFAEAIDRLFSKAFLPKITEDLECVVKRNVSEQIIDDVIETIPFTDYKQRYESLKSCCLEVNLVKYHSSGWPIRKQLTGSTSSISLSSWCKRRVT